MKKGRPIISDQKRDKTVIFRITEKDLERLEKLSTKTVMSKTQVVIEALKVYEKSVAKKMK